ncbi:hypothetical protein IE077_003887, partial [Cardiosporidium cionae]
MLLQQGETFCKVLSEGDISHLNADIQIEVTQSATFLLPRFSYTNECEALCFDLGKFRMLSNLEPRSPPSSLLRDLLQFDTYIFNIEGVQIYRLCNTNACLCEALNKFTQKHLWMDVFCQLSHGCSSKKKCVEGPFSDPSTTLTSSLEALKMKKSENYCKSHSLF